MPKRQEEYEDEELEDFDDVDANEEKERIRKKTKEYDEDVARRVKKEIEKDENIEEKPEPKKEIERETIPVFVGPYAEAFNLFYNMLQRQEQMLIAIAQRQDILNRNLRK